MRKPPRTLLLVKMAAIYSSPHRVGEGHLQVLLIWRSEKKPKIRIVYVGRLFSSTY